MGKVLHRQVTRSAWAAILAIAVVVPLAG